MWQGCGTGSLFLPLRKRYWIDLDQEITKLYLSGASYRQLKYMVGKRIDGGAGLIEPVATLSRGSGEGILSGA